MLPVTPWQERRSAFNHDWLQNRFVQTLGGAIAFLKGEFREEGFLGAVAERLLSQWNTHRGQASNLIETFESEMSPRVLLSSFPLNKLDSDTRGWLAPVVHECWLKRGGLQQLLADARLAEERYRIAFLVVEEHFQRIVGGAAGDLTPLLPALEDLEHKARALSAAISRLPDHIEVT